MSNGPVAADELRLLIERIERMEANKKEIADDIKSVYAEAKARGFCPKTMKQVVKLRGMDVQDRRELEAMLDLYKGALGMLDGTPLGRWAAEKLDPPKEPDDSTPSDDEPNATDEDAAPVEPKEPEPSIDDAREMGRTAAREGKSVTANPFPARDARRAAWDEAWCQELGTDGMDIPDALKPTPKAKKPKGEGDDATGGEGDA